MGHTEDRWLNNNNLLRCKQNNLPQTSRKSYALPVDTNINKTEEGQELVCLLSQTSAETAAINEIWYTDSRAFCHMIPVPSRFLKMETIAWYQVHMGDELSLESKRRVIVDLLIKIGSITKRCTLKNVPFVPSLHYSLIFIAMFADKGIISHFTDKRATFTNNSIIIAAGSRSGTVYVLDTVPVITRLQETTCIAADLKTLHKPLGHVNSVRIVRMSPKNIFTGLSITKNSESTSCSSWSFGKMTRTEIPTHSNDKNVYLLGIVHNNVCRRIEHASEEIALFFVTIIERGSK